MADDLDLKDPTQLSALDLEAELNNLGMSKAARPLFDAVKKHIADNVAPISDEFYRLGEGRAERWSWAPGQLELLQTAKDKAKASGLWNFFLPTSEIGRGLTKSSDYAYIAAELGRASRFGLRVAQLLGPRHPQPGSAGKGRHARTDGKVAEAAAQRRDPLGVRHDRAGPGLLRRQEHRLPRRADRAMSG